MSIASPAPGPHRAAALPPAMPRLLAGPPPGQGAETFAQHLARLGPRPRAAAQQQGAALIAALERSGLGGRGGAGFPAGRKWRSVAANAQRAGGRAVVLANGAEGEPLSAKDRVLMALRPHLVLDGLLLAAEAVGAADAVVYLPRAFADALQALEQALRERRLAGEPDRWVRVVAGPHRYVAGEESAAVAFLDGREARPAFVPPRPFERGAGGLPTLVQNVETLAQAALVARFGDLWFRSAGTPASPGSVLLTLAGAVARPGVYEVAQGMPLGEVVALAGGATEPPRAVLVGGYAGRWLDAETAWATRVDTAAMAAAGTPLGCAAVAVLPQGACPLHETQAVLDFLARESAGQCGPCRHGLDAIAATVAAVASGRGGAGDVDRLRRWGSEVTGRGACHHPDGAAGFLHSALTRFGPSLEQHLRRGPCEACRRPPLLPVPQLQDTWR